jgi:hypothetical protein
MRTTWRGFAMPMQISTESIVDTDAEFVATHERHLDASRERPASRAAADAIIAEVERDPQWRVHGHRAVTSRA